jgi:hypothetical protein
MLSSVLAKAVPGIRWNDHTPVVNFRLELEWQQAIMAPEKEEILEHWLNSGAIGRSVIAFVALAFCFVAGYFLAGLWSSARGTSPLAQIYARVDYVNSLQENLKGQDNASEEVRAEFKTLVEKCRTALRDRAEEND